MDPSWTLEAYPNDPHYAFYETLRTSYRLDSCAAAEPSRDALPVSAAFAGEASLIPAQPPRYHAAVHLVPDKKNKSRREYLALDVAVLRISDAAPCMPACTLPRAFPFIQAARTLPNASPSPAVESFGYAVRGENGELKGVSGVLTRYVGGDERFAGIPLYLEWAANFNVAPGTSGGPILYKNTLLGIELGAESDQVVNLGLSISAIQSILKEQGAEKLIPAR
ncbi:MAG: hypothetical protein HY436_00160 [Candidatus Liptonbacteria bacterium]|nr:hypothetical protein [Candidatus Liptonbacteria bacterium]